MSGNRVEKVNELLKREVGGILLREYQLEDNVLITITGVNTAANFQSAKVYISIIPVQKSDKILDYFNRHVYEIQKRMDRHLKMRPVPKIIFEIDLSDKQVAHTLKVINRLSDKSSSDTL